MKKFSKISSIVVISVLLHFVTITKAISYIDQQPIMEEFYEGLDKFIDEKMSDDFKKCCAEKEDNPSARNGNIQACYFEYFTKYRKQLQVKVKTFEGSEKENIERRNSLKDVIDYWIDMLNRRNSGYEFLTYREGTRVPVEYLKD